MASVIVVLVGLPGAGKTTFSKFCEDYLHDNEVTVFHYDDLCQQFSAVERKIVLTQVEEFVQKSAIKNSGKVHVIIIDDNNYYTSMQAEYLKLCKKLKLGYVIVYLKISEANAQKQNMLRNMQVPAHVITEMASKLEEPKGENVLSVDVNHLLSNNTQFNMTLLKAKIESASNNPYVLQEPHTIVSLPQSLLQKVDIALRRIVNSQIRNLSDKSAAQEILLWKKQIYTKICRKEITISSFNSPFIDDIDVGALENELEEYFDKCV